MVGGVGDKFVGGAYDVVSVVDKVNFLKATYSLYGVRFCVRFVFFRVIEVIPH